MFVELSEVGYTLSTYYYMIYGILFRNRFWFRSSNYFKKTFTVVTSGLFSRYSSLVDVFSATLYLLSEMALKHPYIYSMHLVNASVLDQTVQVWLLQGLR